MYLGREPVAVFADERGGEEALGAPAGVAQVSAELAALLPDVSGADGGGLDEEGEEVCVLSSGAAAV